MADLQFPDAGKVIAAIQQVLDAVQVDGQVHTVSSIELTETDDENLHLAVDFSVNRDV